MPLSIQQLFRAIEQLDVTQVQTLLAHGISAEATDSEYGRPLAVWGDGLFAWWQQVADGYATTPLTEQQKITLLQPHIEIFDLLLAAGANVHLWDSDEFYGVLWDAASAACVPMVQRLLDLQVNPNSIDDEGLPILSSVCDLWFERDFQLSDLTAHDVLPEQRATLQLLRQYGAKTQAEL